MPISDVDALATHAAIHSGKTAVKLQDGSTLPVVKAKNGCRSIKFPGFQAMEQNKTKASAWATKAKDGAKITWFLSGPMGSWGRIVDGKVEHRGKAILPEGSGSCAAKAKSKVESSSGAAKATAKAQVSSRAAKGKVSPKRRAPPEPSLAATKKAKSETATKVESASAAIVESPVAKKPFGFSDSSDPLALAPLFAGMGHGSTWESILRPVLENLVDAPAFIGPGRNKKIVPVRELTFQALKPNPPGGWRVVSFGQTPYPRIESATGIAHFDSELKDWDGRQFGSVVSMRCIIKAAAMHKFGIPKSTKVPELRELLKIKHIVGPAEWFQAVLAQGVLLMNAACTLEPEQGSRAGECAQAHLVFWTPVIEAVVNAVLEDCSKSKRGVVFAWWGSESLKIKKSLDKSCFSSYPGVKLKHIEHKNPAAMGDAFCDDPNIFGQINKAIEELSLGRAIDWLPATGWQAALGKSASVADEMGAFMAETQELHKMYLDRLKDGLDNRADDLDNIIGVMCQPLVKLPVACKPLKLEKPAEASVNKAKSMSKSNLTVEEAAAVHLYTTNFLYKALNAALRDPDRKKAKQYFLYLRLLITALQKLPTSRRRLYRGVALDLAEQYKMGTEVTWWAVSSCTSDLKVASSFGGAAKNTLFIIDSARSVGIRDFSQYKSEEEYILGPGTEFKVTKVQRIGSSIEVHMKELERPRRVQ